MLRLKIALNIIYCVFFGLAVLFLSTITYSYSLEFFKNVFDWVGLPIQSFGFKSLVCYFSSIVIFLLTNFMGFLFMVRKFFRKFKQYYEELMRE